LEGIVAPAYTVIGKSNTYVRIKNNKIVFNKKIPIFLYKKNVRNK